MIKYFFGYCLPIRDRTGVPFPVKWIEDNGNKIGPDFQVEKRIEISKLEFEGRPLEVLMVQHPYKVVGDLT